MDLSRMFERIGADWAEESSALSTLSTSAAGLSTPESQQRTDDARTFHCFHSFQSNTTHHEINEETRGYQQPATRASELLSKTMERVERVEIGVERVALSEAWLFPLENGKMERVESKLMPAEPAADWWDGPAMAEFDALLAPTTPAAPPPLIPPEQVQVEVRYELQALEDAGRTGHDALHAAVAIVRARVINLPSLAVHQVGSGKCFVCEGKETPERPFIAVLSQSPSRVHWLHIGCHAEHVRRLEAKVDTIMTAAGYGADGPPLGPLIAGSNPAAFSQVRAAWA